MVMDFSDVKAIAKKTLVDAWDHAFLVYENDTQVIQLLAQIAQHKTVILPCVPTAENLAAEAFKQLSAQYQDVYGNQLKLERIRLYETPNSWADATS